MIDSANFDERQVSGYVELVFAFQCFNVSNNRYLYEILVNKVVNRREIPLLLCFNKNDLPNAGPLKLIVSSLEKELYAEI